MKPTEEFINDNSKVIHWDWGSNAPILKGTYKNEYTSGEVKVYKLSQKELQEYLKKFR